MRQKSKKNVYAAWDQWDPVGYLDTYFHDLRRDEDETLEFLVRNITKLPRRKKIKVLEFGTGPTVVHGLAVAPIAKEIHLADYLATNLQEINKWLFGDKSAFNWDVFTRRILQLENKTVTDKKVQARNKDLQKKVTKLLLSDASLSNPLKEMTDTYELILMTYCVDSATSSKKVWRGYMKNVLNLLAPEGTILIAALHKCKFYTIGKNRFPSANITEKDMRNALLENGFRSERFSIEIKEVPECIEEGYSGLIFVNAIKDK